MSNPRNVTAPEPISDGSTRYPIELAIQQVRDASRRSDPVSLATVELGEKLAESVREQMADRDLRLVADTMILTAASLGYLAVEFDSKEAAILVNIGAVAGVTILDYLTEQEQTK